MAGGTKGEETVEVGNLRAMLRSAWQSLPVLLVSGSAVCLASILILLVAGGITPWALVLGGIIVGPLMCALIAQTSELYSTGECPPAFSLFGYLRRVWKVGLQLGVLPGAAAAFLLVSLEVFAQTRSPLVVVSVGACGFVLTLSTVLYVVGAPLSHMVPGLRFVRLALISLHVAARRPVPLLAILSVVIVFAILSSQFGLAFLLLLPGPLALTIAGAARSSLRAVE